MHTSGLNFSQAVQRLKQEVSIFTRSNNKVESNFVSNQLQAAALRISNQQTKYQLTHGPQFETLLDPRDRILEHDFSFDACIDRKELQKADFKFIQSKMYANILEKIKLFLVETLSNIVSISFKFLCGGQLEDKESKAYASKNIMLNVHSIYRQTVASIVANPLLKNKINEQDLKNNLILQIDNIIMNILVNLADSYPQAAAAGGTLRMRQVIKEVNRVDDQQNDFIYNNGINISDYLDIKTQKDAKGNMIENLQLGQNGDYTSFIMEVINAAIKIPQDSKYNSDERTNFQVYTEFNERLFWLSEQKEYQRLLTSISKTQELQFSISKRQKKQKTDNVISAFNKIFGADQVMFSQHHTNSINNLLENFEEGVQTMKSKHKFALGQKIPASLKPFSNQQIQNKQFKARHSSILRILSKWAQCLEQIFENSENMIRDRLYPYIDFDGELCNLKNDSEIKLNRRLEEEYRQVKTKFTLLLKNSYGYIGKLLAEEKDTSFVSSVSRFTEIRTVSSKLNAILTSLMLNYTNILIHHLLKAGQKISTDKGEQDINLIVFRVNDLMRSKFQCSESSFIAVLRTMYLLDSKQSMKSNFKIVNIRNKLDGPANNIIINYLFKGKVQCELQLSIAEAKGKQKNYYVFSHFVYQLTRGKFGSIAECAIMNSQLDPMITACRSGYYQEKEETLPLMNQKADMSYLMDSLRGSMSSYLGFFQPQQVMKAPFFECSKCDKLITTQNLSNFLNNPTDKICYSCIVKQQNTIDYLNPTWRSLFSNISKKRLKNYRKLRALKQNKYLISLSSSGEIFMFVVTYIPDQLKTFQIKLDKKGLQKADKNNYIDFSSLQIDDISSKIKQSLSKLTPPKSLTFIFDNIDIIPEDIMNILGMQKQLLKSKMGITIDQFKQYREEMNIVRSIKYKAEIIMANKKKGKVLDKVCRVLVLRQGRKMIDNMFEALIGQSQQVEQKNEQDKLKLIYNKEKELDLSNMLKIIAQKVEFTVIPRWIIECESLKILHLDYNKIQKVEKRQLPTSLIQLSLKSNIITSIDISQLTKLEHFFINDNRLTELNLENNNELKQLTFRQNYIKKIRYLPISLEKIWMDNDPAVAYDFEGLTKLKYLKIYHGSAKREDIKNLAKGVQFRNKG